MLPLIFNLYVAMLSIIIDQAVAHGIWKGVYYHSIDLHILHMPFADDIIIFGETTLANNWDFFAYNWDFFVKLQVKDFILLNPN